MLKHSAKISKWDWKNIQDRIQEAENKVKTLIAAEVLSKYISTEVIKDNYRKYSHVEGQLNIEYIRNARIVELEEKSRTYKATAQRLYLQLDVLTAKISKSNDQIARFNKLPWYRKMFTKLEEI